MTETVTWYTSLIKPSWAPPAWLFGPVWTALYAIIAVSFGAVFYGVITRRLPVVVALPFVLNLIFNFIYSPVEFGLHNNLLATIDIVLVLLTLVWAFVTIYSRMQWVALANIPYLLWVSFATILQFAITWLNR